MHSGKYSSISDLKDNQVINSLTAFKHGLVELMGSTNRKKDTGMSDDLRRKLMEIFGEQDEHDE